MWLVCLFQINPCVTDLDSDFKLSSYLSSSLPAELKDADNKAVLVYLRSIRIRPSAAASSVESVEELTELNRAKLIFIG